MLRVATKVEALSDPKVIPFVLDRGDGFADYGFAGARWVLDLYQWTILAGPSTLPPAQRDRILGLLFGYDLSSISLFDERASGRLFDPTSGSAAPASR